MNHVNAVGASKFSSKKEKILGKNLIETGFPIDKIVKDFWEFAKNNDTLKYMIELSTKHWKIGNKIVMTKDFVNDYITEYCGLIVKSKVYHTL